MDKSEARAFLKQFNLRVTGSRLAVVLVLVATKVPLSFSEVLQKLGDNDWDNATIYRSLIKLRDVGAASVVSKVDGIDRYVLAIGKNEAHHHPHFMCDACGKIACLPNEMVIEVKEKDRWTNSIKNATVQLNGYCPDCFKA